MKVVEYKYSYTSWGHNESELFRFDVENKRYFHVSKGQPVAAFCLPDSLVDTICNFFEPLCIEFPENIVSYDAPIWSLTIDDRSCTRIAVSEFDNLYAKISEFVEVFAKNDR